VPNDDVSIGVVPHHVAVDGRRVAHVDRDADAHVVVDQVVKNLGIGHSPAVIFYYLGVWPVSSHRRESSGSICIPDGLRDVIQLAVIALKGREASSHCVVDMAVLHFRAVVASSAESDRDFLSSGVKCKTKLIGHLGIVHRDATTHNSACFIVRPQRSPKDVIRYPIMDKRVLDCDPGQVATSPVELESCVCSETGVDALIDNFHVVPSDEAGSSFDDVPPSGDRLRKVKFRPRE
jgi:hypothetical protein